MHDTIRGGDHTRTETDRHALRQTIKRGGDMVEQADRLIAASRLPRQEPNKPKLIAG